MRSGSVIPLFPLYTVLFPHTMLPLHIFEYRYRQMVDDCLETGDPFGIVLIRSGEEVGENAEPYEIGTLARIMNLERLEDGRIHLTAVGEERFRIVSVLEGAEPYLKAVIEPWQENPWIAHDRNEVLTVEVGVTFEQYLRDALEAYDVEVKQVNLPTDPVQLSFAVAATLQTTLAFKQYLLELQDTGERLRLLLKVLEDFNRLSRVQSFNPDRWQAYLSAN